MQWQEDAGSQWAGRDLKDEGLPLRNPVVVRS